MQNDALEPLLKNAYVPTIAGFPGNFTLTGRIARLIAEEIVDFDDMLRKLLAAVSERGVMNLFGIFNSFPGE